MENSFDTGYVPAYYEVMSKVKKSFWLEQEQADRVEKQSNTLKVTESQIIRNLIENL